MAKRNFDAFYYGVGMKLDEASIEKAGQQIEGKLNQVVDNVKSNLRSISDAVNKGVKDIDTKGLVGALVEAQRELGDFNDFNPKELKHQIASLEMDFRDLKTTLGDVADSIKGFKDLGGFISDVATRLEGIEIVAPKMGKDALKKDIAEMNKVARGFANIFAGGQKDIPTDALDAYVKKVKDGIASIKASGNGMELFVDGDLAKDLVKVLGVLREMGAPVSALHTELFDVIYSMRTAFKDAGVTEAFKDVGYQIDEMNHQLGVLASRMKPYEDRIENLRKLTRDWQNDLAKADSELLSSFKTTTTVESLDVIIAKIQEYENVIKDIEDVEDPTYQSAMANMLALAQATEKQMEAMSKKKVAPFLARWSEAFDGSDLKQGNKFSTTYLEMYRQDILDIIDGIKKDNSYKDLEKQVRQRQEYLAKLMSSNDQKGKPGRPEGTKNRERRTTDVTKSTGEKFVISPELQIDASKWAKTINDTLTSLAESGKIKPVDLRINTQSTKITADLNKIREAINNTLKGTRGSRKKDDKGNPISTYTTGFDSSFKSFLKQLENAKKQLIEFIDTKWKPKLKEAFAFEMTVDGKQKQEAQKEVGAFIRSYIDALNIALEDKPIQLKSNIDALIEEIKTKTQNIKIESGEVDFKIGDIELPKQTIGNIMLAVDTGDLAKDDTVRKIYNLLSVRKGDGKHPNDDRIAELKKLIAASEASERKIYETVQAKASAEQRGAEAVDKKVEAEQKVIEAKAQSESKTSTSKDTAQNTQQKQPEPQPKVEEKTTKDQSGFDKQQIYNEVHHEIKKALGGFKDVKSALDWVKEQAKEYGEALENAEEGSEEYFKAQTGLTTLLHQWRSKISSGKKDNPWRYEKYVGFQGGGRNWSKYLKDFGLQDLFPKDFELLKETKFREEQGLEEPKAPKKQSSRSNSNKKEEETAEEMIARRFKQNQELTQYILKLAKWAKALGTIANGIDYTITERDFGDRDTVTRNGVTYTRKDLEKNQGKIFSKGDRVTSEALDQFIADYENSEDEEFKELFGFVKKMIENYREAQKKLNATLKELDGTDVARNYADADDKSEYLSKGIKSSFNRVMANNGNKNAQANVKEILSRYGVLDQFEKLSTAKDPEEIKQVVRNIASYGNFGKLIEELSSVEGNMGKSYNNLVNFMKIFKDFRSSEYFATEAGFEAQKWIRGTTVEKDKYKKEYDPQTGRSVYTNEKIGVKSEIVEKGLRQAIQEFSAIFIDELGKRAFGFNDGGPGITDEFLRVGKSTSFNKIIKFLERALSEAADIQLSGQKGIAKDYVDVSKHERIGEMASAKPTYNPSVTKKTQSEEVEQQIAKSKKDIQESEIKLQQLRTEIQEVVSDAENVNKVLDIETKKDEKKQEIKAQSDKVDRIQSEINKLEKELTDPSESFESIATRLLQKQEALLEMEKQYEHMPNKTPKDEYLRDQVKEKIKQQKGEIQRLQSRIQNADTEYLKRVLVDQVDKTTSDIEQLEKEYSNLMANANIGEKKVAEKEMADEQAKLFKLIEEARQRKETLTNPDEIQAVDNQIEEWVQLNKRALAVRSRLLEQIKLEEEPIKELEKRIALKKNHLKLLQTGFDHTRKLSTSDLESQLDAKSQELAQAQTDQDKLQSDYNALQTSEDEIVNKELEALRARKAEKEARIKEINATKDASKNAQLQAERQTLETEIAEIDKHINEGIVAIVQRINTAMQTTQEKLDRAQQNLINQEVRLKEVDKNAVNYTKGGKSISKSEAESLLPQAQATKDFAQKELDAIKNQLLEETTNAIASVMAKEKAGELSSDDRKKFMQSIRTQPINESFIAGKITEKEYIEQLTKAYITMRNATSKADIEAAEADAKRLASAQKNVINLEKEIKLLKEIITLGDRVNKVDSPKPTSESNTKPETKKEDKKTSETQKTEEKTKTAETKKQTNEEKKKTTETKKQAEAEKQKTAETKKQVKAEKQKTEEAKEQKTEEKKKVVETSKQVDAEKAKTAETQKQATDSAQINPISQSTDVILGTTGKDDLALLKAFRVMMQEVAEGNRVFREHGFSMKDGRVIGISRGLYAQVSRAENANIADTYGHFHPRNTMYSGQDVGNMADRKKKNANYNADFLFTPDYVHAIEGIQNVSIETLTKIEDKWKRLESLPLDTSIIKAVKESDFATLARQNSIFDYTKFAMNSDGTLTDVSKSVVRFTEEIEEKIMQWGQTLKEINDAMTDRNMRSSDDFKALQNKEKSLYGELIKDSSFAAIAPSREQLIQNKRIKGTMYDKKHAATLIQEAVDFDLDLSLFIEQFKKFFESMSSLGEKIPDGSALAKIKGYINQTDGMDESQLKSLVEEMKPYVLEVFKKNVNARLDIRDKGDVDLLRAASKNSIYKNVLEAEIARKSKNVDDTDDFDNEGYAAREAWRAELAELEAQRDADTVDPRFATVEKQEEIIRILNAGIKVNGKLTAEKGEGTKTDKKASETSDGEKDTNTKATEGKKKKTPKIPTVGRVDLQSEAINNLTDVNKDWDVYKNYIAVKQQLDRALESAKTKGDTFTSEDADKIRAIRDQVLSLGNDVIKTSESFTNLKARSEDAASGVKMGVTDVKEDMLSMVHEQAVATQSLISDISFDEEKQKMTAVLMDLDGQTTRVTMSYSEMFNAIITTSDKTTDSVRRIYKTVEGEMTKMVEAQNLIDVSGKKELGESKEFEAYSTSYKKMLESANNVREKGTLATKEEKNELIALRKQVETTRIAFEKMAKASNDFDAKVGQNVIGMNNTQTLETQMRNYVLNSQEWSASQRRMIEETWKFNDAQNSASYSVEKNKGQLASMSVVADMGTKRIGQYTEETKKYKSGMEKFMDSLKNKWQEVARYLMTFGSMYRVFALLKQGVTYIKEIDTALTELKKVTNETEEAYDKFLNTAAKTADKVGSTIKEIVSSTADWARIGYSMKEAATLAESTAILLNVSEFQSIDEATSALTSTLQAFSYTAEQSMDVVDVLNEVGKIVARR